MEVGRRQREAGEKTMEREEKGKKTKFIVNKRGHDG
jgi:hypothetical protein